MYATFLIGLHPYLLHI